MPPSRHRRRGKDRLRQSILAPLSVAFLLACVFSVAALRGTGLLFLSGLVSFLGLVGFLLGQWAERRIHRHHGVIQGHAAALIGKWGNLGLFVLALVLFIWELARAILSGRLDL